MPRIWIALFLFVGLGCSGQAMAQSGCNIDRIRTQLESSETFPDLMGCRPDSVRPLLQNHDYGLEIENRVESRTYREGRIVSQRVDDGYVFVEVSSGPGPERRNPFPWAEVIEGVGRIITSRPPNEQPTLTQPATAQPQVPDERLRDVLTIPPAPPPVQAPVTERIPPPEPAPSPPAVVAPVATPAPPAPAAEDRVTRAPERPPEAAPAPQPADPAPPPAPATDDLSLQPEPGVPPPAVQDSRGPAASGGNPPPASGPTVREGTSASNGSETGRVERTPWWKILLQPLAALPVWALALAGTAAAAGLGLFLMPRATCSIEGGSLGWGARRPRVGWPEAHAEVVMGKPLFSVPSPLPIGRREDVQPSAT